MSLVFNWNPQRALVAPPPVVAPRRTQIRDAALALRDVDVATRTITGQASNRAEDAMGDEIPPTALDLARFRQNPVLLKDHDHHASIGTVVRDWITSEGWWIEAKLFADGVSAAADQAWREIQAGARRGLSIGFQGVTWEPRQTSQGGQGVKWTRIRVHEVSSVNLPACPSCLLSGHKSTGHRCAPVAAGRSDEVVLVLDDEAPTGRVSPLSPGVWIGGAAAGARALTERLRGGRR